MATPPPPAQPVEFIEIPQPPIQAMVPPCCRVANTPHRIGGSGRKVYLRCQHCGRSLLMVLGEDGQLPVIRVVR